MWIFNHVSVFLSTLPARGATPARRCPQIPKGFLSTLPARGATGPCTPPPCPGTDFYPRSPRGERPVDARPANTDPSISIHAPREGSDSFQALRLKEGEKISIHAPREGSDPVKFSPHNCCCIFLSTLPARGATICHIDQWVNVLWHFYPRSPRGERLGLVGTALVNAVFLSTLPARGAT